jgi:UDP:flavonoid glycosyltransferase YjiC (YdhE family)
LSADNASVLGAIAKRGFEVNAYFRASIEAETLLAREVNVRQKPFGSGEMLSSDLILHGGGLNLSQEAVFSSVRQITMPTHVEGFLNGLALARLGVGLLYSAELSASKNVAIPLLERIFAADVDHALMRCSCEFEHRLRESNSTSDFMQALQRIGIEPELEALGPA